MSNTLLNCSAFPPVMSYHTHIVFMLTSTSQIQKAEALREEAKIAFKDFFGADSACRGTAEDPSGRYGNFLHLQMSAFDDNIMILSFL